MRNVHASNCVAISCNKTKILPTELARLRKMSRRKVQDQIQKGYKVARTWLGVVNKAEEGKYTFNHYCPNCGFPRETPGKCLRRDNCKKRSLFLAEAFRHTAFTKLDLFKEKNVRWGVIAEEGSPLLESGMFTKRNSDSYKRCQRHLSRYYKVNKGE